MTNSGHDLLWPAAIAALTVVVIISLPWEPFHFGLLSLAMAFVHGWLAVRARRGLERVAWMALDALWVLGALSSFYAPPQYNIRVDWAFFQLLALPLTGVVHLVVSLLRRNRRQSRVD